SVCSASVHSIIFNHAAATEIYTLSLHDALPICLAGAGEARARAPCRPSRQRAPANDRDDPGEPRLHGLRRRGRPSPESCARGGRSEEHTSELQSRENLVCRLLLEKKNMIEKHSD